MTRAQIFLLKRHRLTVILRLLLRAYFLSRTGQRDATYNMIGNELFKLGGVYIKFLQGVILQSWLMQRWRSKRKLDIFTKIDSHPVNAKRILKNSLSSTQYKRLSNIGDKPFAVGSFGHVFAATLDTNKKIIVKILTPGLRETVKFDLLLLKLFWNLYLRTIRFNKSLDLNLIFENFRKQTLKEVDYVKEVEFAHRQYLVYKDNPHIVVPKTYLKLCTEEIIVQDYIQGVAVAEILKLKQFKPRLNLSTHVKKELGSDLCLQMENLSYELLWACFDQPELMGDPHPGNVILMKDNKVGLIDFGIKAQATSNPTGFLKFIRSYHRMCLGKFDAQDIFASTFQLFGRDLYLALAKLTHIAPGGRKIDLNKELATMVREVFESEASGVDIEELLVNNPKALVVFERLANKHNRFGFHFNVQDTELLRALITLTGLLDVMGLYRDVVAPAYARVLKQVDKIYPDLQSMNEFDEISHGQAINIAFNWLERLAQQDPGLFRSMLAKANLSMPRETLAEKS